VRSSGRGFDIAVQGVRALGGASGGSGAPRGAREGSGTPPGGLGEWAELPEECLGRGCGVRGVLYGSLREPRAARPVGVLGPPPSAVLEPCLGTRVGTATGCRRPEPVPADGTNRFGNRRQDGREPASRDRSDLRHIPELGSWNRRGLTAEVRAV